MSAEFRNIRLRGFTSEELDRNANQKHEIYLDFDNKTLRISDGSTRGGFALLRNDLSNIKTTALNKSINAGTGIITAAGFTGNVTGNVTGTVTNGVVTTGSYNNPTWITGIASTKITGAIASASSLTTSRNINGVAFDGTANVSINTLVNGSNTLTLDSSGILTTPGSNLSIGDVATPGTSVGILSKANVPVALYSQGISGGVLIGNIPNPVLDPLGLQPITTWNFGVNGTLTAPGNITTTTGIVTSSSVTTGSVTTTNDITVGGNAVISTKPTLKTHATNRGYVDKKAVAMAVALG